MEIGQARKLLNEQRERERLERHKRDNTNPLGRTLTKKEQERTERLSSPAGKLSEARRLSALPEPEPGYEDEPSTQEQVKAAISGALADYGIKPKAKKSESQEPPQLTESQYFELSGDNWLEMKQPGFSYDGIVARNREKFEQDWWRENPEARERRQEEKAEQELEQRYQQYQAELNQNPGMHPVQKLRLAREMGLVN